MKLLLPSLVVCLSWYFDALTGDGEHLQVSVYENDPGEAKES